MKLSQYLVSVKEANQILVFSTYNGEYVIISQDDYSSFLDLSCNQTKKDEYLEKGLYIEDGENEFEVINAISSFKISKSKVKKYRVLTTSACNAHCLYCYEKGIRHYTMDKETSLNVAKFIINHSKENDGIRIEWFGGEPLLNISAISTISEYIQTNLPVGCTYKSNIVTNGFCINDKIIEMMVNKWNVSRIQITIDGVGKRYEEIKQLGAGAFDKLIENLEKLSKTNIKIDVRLNFDKNNLKDIKDVISFLSTLYFKDKLDVYAAKIFSEESKRGYFDLEKETSYVDMLLYEGGFFDENKILPKIFTTPCMAAYPDFFTIDPRGRLFKCDRLLLDENVIDNVASYSEDKLKKTNWANNKLNKKCKSCKLYPLCWGGCYYDRITGIYPCYITETLVINRLNLLLKSIIYK